MDSLYFDAHCAVPWLSRPMCQPGVQILPERVDSIGALNEIINARMLTFYVDVIP